MSPSGQFDQLCARLNQDSLFLQRKVTQELLFANDVVEQAVRWTHRPTRYADEAVFHACLPNKTDNFRQWIQPKPGRKEGFNKKYACQAMLLQLMQLIRQAIIASRRGTIDVSLKCIRKFGINVVPAITPNLYVNGKNTSIISLKPSELFAAYVGHRRSEISD